MSETLEQIALRVANEQFNTVISPQLENDILAFARRLVAALQADGWQMVPKEPTPEMVNASWHAAGSVRFEDGQGKYIAVAYQAMLSAAPEYGK